MRDGWGRRTLKAMARVLFWINVHGTRWIWRVRGEKPFHLGGGCQLCAKCCEAPTIQVSRWTWYSPLLRTLVLGWHRHINGFLLRERHIASRSFVFECTHFDPVTRRCDSYESRPGMCRDYPRALLWAANPTFLEGCGYRPVAPGGDKLRAALEAEGLSAEALEAIEGKLYLK